MKHDKRQRPIGISSQAGAKKRGRKLRQGAKALISATIALLTPYRVALHTKQHPI